MINLQRTQNNLYLVLEYCNGPTLEKYLKEREYFQENEALKYLKDILKGYECLYENKIIHRDLKPANLLLHNGDVKIADFGFSKFIQVGMD